mmetsp:Transcript_20651/g.46193  ORF Transcript_20651/g.46193 Transcript_20651/m.46193 type:complete len:216 (+) Transcript_20651:190-837(+)
MATALTGTTLAVGSWQNGCKNLENQADEQRPTLYTTSAPVTRLHGCSLTVSRHEPSVESCHLLDDVVHVALGREESRSEVPRVFLLPEARARHNNDPSRLQQRQRVEGIGRLARCLRGGLCFSRDSDGRESIHGALRLIACDALERIEPNNQLRRSPLKRRHNRIALLDVLRVRCLTRLRRLDHQPNGNLPHHVGTQPDRDELEQLRLHIRVKTM